MKEMKRVQLCVLCGERPATKGQGDHLPPQCIYPKPRPLGVPWNKVPACTPCNNAGSKDDEQFKLIIGITTGEFRNDKKQVIEALAGTLSKNKRLGMPVLTKHQRGYGRRHGSVFLEPLVAVPFDGQAYMRVIQRIVRGLYWQRTKTILRPDAEIQVVQCDPLPPRLASSIKKLLTNSDRVALNNETFIYKYLIFDDSGSFWGMQFFDKHTVFAFVSPPKKLSETNGIIVT